jgi:hypothetical protein
LGGLSTGFKKYSLTNYLPLKNKKFKQSFDRKVPMTIPDNELITREIKRQNTGGE